MTRICVLSMVVSVDGSISGPGGEFIPPAWSTDLDAWRRGTQCGVRERSFAMKGTCHCGAAEWQLDGDPGPVTACNCTLCRRYGTLWAYGWEGERIRTSGATAVYTRKDGTDPFLEFHFCPACACVLAWRAARPDEDGRRRMAVNVRLAPPEAVADLPIDHFDGLDTFDDLPPDGRCVRDIWA